MNKLILSLIIGTILLGSIIVYAELTSTQTNQASQGTWGTFYNTYSDYFPYIKTNPNGETYLFMLSKTASKIRDIPHEINILSDGKTEKVDRESIELNNITYYGYQHKITTEKNNIKFGDNSMMFCFYPNELFQNLDQNGKLCKTLTELNITPTQEITDEWHYSLGVTSLTDAEITANKMNFTDYQFYCNTGERCILLNI